MKILIDAGHGGSDAGASNPITGQKESDTNLVVSNELIKLLRNNGYDVITTRVDDSDLPLIDRQRQIRNEAPDLVVSVHHNASASGESKGAEVLAQVQDKNGGSSKTFAELLNKEYADIGQTIRPIVFRENAAGTGDYYAILRAASQTGVPAVISEFAFIDNPEDIQKIDTLEKQKAEAQAIFNAINNYFKQ